MLENHRLRIRIKELESVHPWYTAAYAIPAELDEGRSDDVLCLLNDGTFVVAWYDHDDDLWIDSYSERCIQSGRHVTHWRKLLEGPKNIRLARRFSSREDRMAEEMDLSKLKLMKKASYLLPDPGGEVVRECLEEITGLKERLRKTGDLIEEAIGHLDYCGSLRHGR